MCRGAEHSRRLQQILRFGRSRPPHRPSVHAGRETRLLPGILTRRLARCRSEGKPSLTCETSVVVIDTRRHAARVKPCESSRNGFGNHSARLRARPHARHGHDKRARCTAAWGTCRECAGELTRHVFRLFTVGRTQSVRNAAESSVKGSTVVRQHTQAQREEKRETHRQTLRKYGER